MNLDTMDYFVALAEEKSFTKAAERLNITQQTLSAHIANLERKLECKLVDRSIPLELTYAGEIYLGYAKRFQAERRSMEQEFIDISEGEQGRLRVGVASTRGHIIMPDAVCEFRHKHPSVAVDLHEAENAELLELLKNGILDVIVAHVPGEQPSLMLKELYKDEVLLLVSKSLLQEIYGENASDIADKVEETGDLSYIDKCPFMLTSKRDVTGEIARHAFEKSNIRPSVSVLSSNAETLSGLAERGIGACFSPGELVNFAYGDSHADIRIIHLGQPAIYSVQAAWRNTNHTWSMIEDFVKIVDRQLTDTKVEARYI